jgi:hypothetical protein
MGIIWDSANSTHSIIINGNTEGQLNAVDQIFNSPQDGEQLENTLENILKPPGSTGYTLQFKLFDKASMYYAVIVYPIGQDPGDNWWLGGRE